MTRSRRPFATVVCVALLVVAFVAGCGGSTGHLVSFDPSSPCTTDGRQPGAYPELERLLPAEYEGQPPGSVDSGRNCTPDALGALADMGIDGVRFAGATWPLGGTTGLTFAVFEADNPVADDLAPSDMIAFYEAGARAARRTEKLATSEVTVGDRPGRRLDVLGSDGTGQTIVAWPAEADDRVNVLLAADLGDTRVLEVLEALASR